MKTNREIAEQLVIKVSREIQLSDLSGREFFIQKITQALDQKQKVIDVLREGLKDYVLDNRHTAPLEALARAAELEQDDDEDSMGRFD